MQHGFLKIETQNQWYMTDRGISYSNELQKKLFTYFNNIMSSILILMPGIDYDINFNHGKPLIIITFVIECAIPWIILF